VEDYYGRDNKEICQYPAPIAPGIAKTSTPLLVTYERSIPSFPGRARRLIEERGRGQAVRKCGGRAHFICRNLGAVRR